MNWTVSELYHNQTCYINTDTKPAQSPGVYRWTVGLMNAELGKMQFLASPHVAELCLLVASVKTGLWAPLAVKLKAAAQSSLSRVCVWPRQYPDRERAFLRETLGSRTKEYGGTRSEGSYVALQGVFSKTSWLPFDGGRSWELNQGPHACWTSAHLLSYTQAPLIF